jgi:carbon monoxide dehydrogenase subunit G
MKLEQSFEVAAPIDQVWHALNDLERVAPCLPGAAITDHDDDGTYHGTFQVKLGPTTAAYRGTIKIESADESSHSATLKARGTDKRGQGGATATIVNSLEAIEGGTRVTADTDFTITGRLASFGRGGMIEDISNRLLKDFATCLQAHLNESPAAEAPAPEAAAASNGGASAPTPPPRPRPVAQPAEPVQGASLFASVLLARIKKDPKPLLGVLAALLLLRALRKK